MKTLKTITLLSILLTVMIACHSKKKEDHSGHKMTDEKIFYTCSMDPQIKEDKPGKCPICHMHLTPVKHDNSNPNEISLSKQQIRLGNISMRSITETQSSLNQSYTGTLAINQEKIN